MPRASKGARLWYDKSAALWYIRDGSSKRGTGCALADRAGAEAALAAYIAEKYEPAYESRASKVPVSAVLAYYLKEYVGQQRSKTAHHSIAALQRWWRDKTLADIRRSTCKAYIASRLQDGLAWAKSEAGKARRVKEATAGRELTVLRAAINAYHAETPLDALPVVYVPPAAPARTRWLTRDEAARLLRAVRKMDDRQASRALIRFILIGLYTGTRSAAIRELRWEPGLEGGWVDLRKGIIHRRAEGEAETKKRRPPVRIPRRLRGFLERWHRADGGRGTLIHYKGQPLTQQRYSWREACKAAGLGEDVTAHILRHTAVTWMLHAGVSPWDVANYAGMTVAMLEGVYGHHDPQFQEEAADNVGRRYLLRIPATSARLREMHVA